MRYFTFVPYVRWVKLNVDRILKPTTAFDISNEQLHNFTIKKELLYRVVRLIKYKLTTTLDFYWTSFFCCKFILKEK